MARRKPPRPAGWHWSQREPVLRPDGSRSCRFCMGQVPPPRRSFCSEACVLEWTRRTQPRVLRQMIFCRDRGICAACGLDTRDYDLRRLEREAHLARLWYAASRAQRPRIRPRPELRPDGTPWPPEHWAALLTPALTWRLRHKLRPSDPPWDLDHVVPIVLGGDWFADSNLRILCKPCHVHVTRELNARLRATRAATTPAPSRSGPRSPPAPSTPAGPGPCCGRRTSTPATDGGSITSTPSRPRGGRSGSAEGAIPC